MTDSNRDSCPINTTNIDMDGAAGCPAPSELDALEEQLGDDIDIEDLDVEVENEYWVDYSHSHHGIVFAWRNNRKQILLAVEETISPTQEKTGYDIVLMTADGGYIGALESVEDEEEALKTALEYQNEYPKGEFPMANKYEEATDDEGNVKRGWMIEDNPLYEDSSTTEDSQSKSASPSDTSILGRLRSLFSS